MKGIDSSQQAVRVSMEAMSARAVTLSAAALTVVAMSLALMLALLVPPGEAPDEPAHIAYVDAIAAGHLPRPTLDGPFSYESYQPPLAYAVMGLAVRWSGVDLHRNQFVSDPDFAFQRNRRAFLAPPGNVRTRGFGEVRLARAANLAWLVLFCGSIFMVCREVSDRPWIALAAAAPFVLSPQALFASATVTNDAAVAALCAFVTWSLVRTDRGPGGIGMPCAGSVGAGLGLLAKSSAVVVAPAFAVMLIRLAKRRKWRVVAALALPALFIGAGAVLLEEARSGSLVAAPSLRHATAAVRLVLEPRWMASAWVGFWAKLGWFNVVLPGPVYGAFLPATIAAIIGLFTVIRSPRRSGGGWILATIVLTNFALLIVYLVAVDWQPQGRYLLPSSAALAGLAATGLERISIGWRPRTSSAVAMASVTLSLVAAVAAVLVVVRVYGL